MTEHEITIHRYIPKGKNNHHYIAICSCDRWRSEPYREKDHAETKGLIHTSRGDDDLRMQAAFDHGHASLRTLFNWYTEKAEDPFLSEVERTMWGRLADELRPRVQGATDAADIPLWSDEEVEP